MFKIQPTYSNLLTITPYLDQINFNVTSNKTAPITQNTVEIKPNINPKNRGGKFGLIIIGLSSLILAYKTGYINKLWRAFTQPDTQPKIEQDTEKNYKNLTPEEMSELAKKAVEGEQNSITTLRNTPDQDRKTQEQECLSHWKAYTDYFSPRNTSDVDNLVISLKNHFRNSPDIPVYGSGKRSSKKYYVIIKDILCDMVKKMPKDCAIEFMRRAIIKHGLEPNDYNLSEMIDLCGDMNDPNLDLNSDNLNTNF